MFQKIQAAQERLRGHAHVTPVMTSQTLNRRVGTEVFLKCENFQRGGAFKFRGAFNAMSQLSDEQKARGVITYSSGNHAQAVAIVGKALGIKTVVVMPNNAPQTKRAATEEYGAQVVGCEASERMKVAEALQRECGYTMVPPFDDEEIVAGQGTATLEFFEQVGELDALLVPCGGGGLLSGSAIAAKGISGKCRVIGIEPEVADDAKRSFETGVLQSVSNPPTIADGVRTTQLGHKTFPLILKYVDQMSTVSEAAIYEAVQFLFYRMKLVVEPSGVLGVAALLSGSVPATGRMGVLLSGGNIDGPTITRILAD
ncbi:MAG: pyridoxal-phosphate dependent enzyme [Limisphaerales bacterium]